jgi:hypothetical protein
MKAAGLRPNFVTFSALLGSLADTTAPHDYFGGDGVHSRGLESAAVAASTVADPTESEADVEAAAVFEEGRSAGVWAQVLLSEAEVDLRRCPPYVARHALRAALRGFRLPVPSQSFSVNNIPVDRASNTTFPTTSAAQGTSYVKADSLVVRVVPGRQEVQWRSTVTSEGVRAMLRELVGDGARLVRDDKTADPQRFRITLT